MIKPDRDWKPEIKLFTKILITLIILIASLVIIFGKYPDDYVKVAFGFIGIVLGYWLK